MVAPKPMVTVNCAECKRPFRVKAGQLAWRRKRSGREEVFCGHRCSTLDAMRRKVVAVRPGS